MIERFVIILICFLTFSIFILKKGDFMETPPWHLKEIRKEKTLYLNLQRCPS